MSTVEGSLKSIGQESRNTKTFTKLKDQKSGQSILSVGVSPVSQSVKQENVLELMMKDGFGQSSTDSFAKLDQDGSWLKMCQDSYQQTLDGRLQKFSGTWPRAGMMSSGTCFQREDLVALGRCTKGNGSSLSVSWPSPRVSDTEGGLVKNVELKDGSFSRVNKDGVRWGVKLKDAVNHMETLWPTMTVNDSKNNCGPSQLKRKALNVAVGGALNPAWVEWLMGFPIGWTDLEHLETQSSPKSPTK